MKKLKILILEDENKLAKEQTIKHRDHLEELVKKRTAELERKIRSWKNSMISS